MATRWVARSIRIGNWGCDLARESIRVRVCHWRCLGFMSMLNPVYRWVQWLPLTIHERLSDNTNCLWFCWLVFLFLFLVVSFLGFLVAFFILLLMVFLWCFSVVSINTGCVVWINMVVGVGVGRMDHRVMKLMVNRWGCWWGCLMYLYMLRGHWDLWWHGWWAIGRVRGHGVGFWCGANLSGALVDFWDDAWLDEMDLGGFWGTFWLETFCRESKSVKICPRKSAIAIIYHFIIENTCMLLSFFLFVIIFK